MTENGTLDRLLDIVEREGIRGNVRAEALSDGHMRYLDLRHYHDHETALHIAEVYIHKHRDYYKARMSYDKTLQEEGTR